MTDPALRVGVYRWESLLTAQVLEEIQHRVRSAAWQERSNEAGSVLALAGKTHGALTGHICDYFSHPQLVAQIGELTGLPLQHFLGTLIQVQPGHTFSAYHSRFAVAMQVNLSAQTITAWDLAPGDARILKHDNQRPPNPLVQESTCFLVDGYYV